MSIFFYFTHILYHCYFLMNPDNIKYTIPEATAIVAIIAIGNFSIIPTQKPPYVEQYMNRNTPISNKSKPIKKHKLFTNIPNIFFFITMSSRYHVVFSQIPEDQNFQFSRYVYQDLFQVLYSNRKS